LSLLLTVLMAAIVMLAVGLVWALLRLQKRIDALHVQFGVVPVVSAGAVRPRPIIEIQILNAFELAVRESPFAGPVSKPAPRMIERIVYMRAADQIAEQLKAQGVNAQVRAHVA
jgi:hypothetical protein